MSEFGPRRYRIVNGVATPITTRIPWAAQRIARVSTVALLWAYVAALLALDLAARFSPPEFWPVHLILYGPRWSAVLPLLALIPLAVWMRLRWSALPLGVALISLVSFSGFNIPWRSLLTSAGDSDSTLRVLTCNVQGHDLMTRNLTALIEAVRPDVICLQECNLSNPLVALGLEGWHCRSSGEFCLASRDPIIDFEELHRPDKRYRIVAVRARLVRSGKTIPLICVHLMTPRRGLAPLADSRVEGFDSFRAITQVQRMESKLLRRWVEKEPGSIVLAGDFNLTAEHPLFRRDWNGYRDAFSWTNWGMGSTMFTRLIGLRIDHILCGSTWRPQRCRVGSDVGSAHVPVIADLVEQQ